MRLLLLLLRVDAVQETTTLDKECRSIGDVREEYTQSLATGIDRPNGRH